MPKYLSVFIFICLQLTLSAALRLQERANSIKTNDCPDWSGCPTITSAAQIFSDTTNTWETLDVPQRPTVTFLRNPELQQTQIFAAVFTSPKHIDLRTAIRDYWHMPRGVMYKFILCNSTKQLELLAEETLHNDIMWVSCQEAYEHLTEKLVGTMKAFNAMYNGPSRAKFFLKIDDDSYPHFDKLLPLLSEVGHDRIYGGVFYPAGNKVIANSESSFYDPLFVDKTYPMTAAGGPGYILGDSVLKDLLDLDIANETKLPSLMEDRATALWIQSLNTLLGQKASSTKKKAKQTKEHDSGPTAPPVENSEKLVVFLNIPGTDGYQFNKKHCSGKKKKSYEFVLHHNLLPSQIECLSLQNTSRFAGVDCLCI